MNHITTDDLQELTARNVKNLGFDVSKLASSMSKDVSTALFQTHADLPALNGMGTP